MAFRFTRRHFNIIVILTLILIVILIPILSEAYGGISVQADISTVTGNRFRNDSLGWVRVMVMVRVRVRVSQTVWSSLRHPTAFSNRNRNVIHNHKRNAKPNHSGSRKSKLKSNSNPLLDSILT